jgi:hypothetical protein
MSLRRLTTAIALATGTLGIAAGLGMSPATAATGQTTVRLLYTCGSGECTGTTYAGAVFYPSDGAQSYTLATGDKVEVQCWYTTDNPPKPDGYWDHVIAINGNANYGHVSDESIDFGGNTAKSLGLPECG